MARQRPISTPNAVSDDACAVLDHPGGAAVKSTQLSGRTLAAGGRGPGRRGARRAPSRRWDAAEREHLAVEGDFALIARPRTGRPVNADTGAATIVTPAEVPSLGGSPKRTRRCRSVSRCQAGSRPCRAAGRASRAVPPPGGRQRARRPPRSSNCMAVAEPVGLLPEPAAGRADAKAARHGRPTAAPKR